jgi:hypothetical protein
LFNIEAERKPFLSGTKPQATFGRWDGYECQDRYRFSRLRSF